MSIKSFLYFCIWLNNKKTKLWLTLLLTIVLHVVLVSMNVLLKQSLKVISIKLILMYVLTADLAQKYVLLKQFIRSKSKGF